MQISENQNKAAGEIVDEIGSERAVHLATAIATAARLSGSFLFRSFNLSLEGVEPGTAILSEEANEKGPELIDIIGAVLHSLGIVVDNDKMKSASVEKSRIDFLESLELSQAKAIKIMQDNNLSYKEMAIACSISTGFIIKESKSNLEIETGFTTAIFGLIEGTKTVPPRIGTIRKQEKKWYKFW